MPTCGGHQTLPSSLPLPFLAMVDVSIGLASACIAAVITILQFLLPNALALILTGHVSESHSAVTWSVVSRIILTSDWPLFLRSDHSASSAVPRTIAVLTWVKPMVLTLIAVSAIVTPLGLYDRVAPSSSSRVADFVYVADESIIGSGTPARSDRGYNFSRSCASKYNNYPQLCPGDPYLGNVTRVEISNYTTNETAVYSYFVLSESISPSLIDLYQGGLTAASSSLSSFFDIQYRQWTIYSDFSIKNNGTLLTRAIKYLSSILMDNKYELFEGIVADTRSGGIGFRNHSVPSIFSPYGSEWEEDILWIQPEAACVNSNLTSRFVGTLTGYGQLAGQLVDQGGFTNIEKIAPYPNNSYPFGDGQNKPMLYERAYWLAWYLNANAMEYLDITDPGTNRSRISSSIGQTFTVNSTFNKIAVTSSYINLARGHSFGDLVASAPYEFMWNASTNQFDLQDNPGIPNPHNITKDKVADAAEWLKGYAGGDRINISTIAVQLGYIMGPPKMSNQVDPNNASSVATYERPLYICSAATKASIKTIRFRYNSTTVNNLRNLEILDIRDKIYERDDQKPLWGLETPWFNSTNTWNISSINPLWGIVDEAASTNHNVSTIRSDHFYLPAAAGSVAEMGYLKYPTTVYDDYLAGTTGPPDNWVEVFDPSSNQFVDDNLQVRFFEELTRNSSGTEKLIKLMWTDYASNYMVGTRGLHSAKYKPMLSGSAKRRRDTDLFSLPESETSNLADGQYPVYVLERQIRYRWIWGIPALICVAIVGLAVLYALIGAVFGNATISRLRHLMYNISTGRVFASFVYPDSRDDKSVHTKRWIKSVGHKPIEVYGRSSAVDQMELADVKQSRTYVQITQKDDFETASTR